MDISTILQVISSVGFPIAMCLIMCWYINKSEERHRDEVGELRKAIDNNTAVVTELITRLEE